MKAVYAVLITLFIVASLIYLDEIVACNPKGSIADQLNWAGHKTCDE